MILRLILHNLFGRIVCQSVVSIGKIEFRAATDMMLLKRIDKVIWSQLISDCNKKLLKKLNVNFFLLQIINFWIILSILLPKRIKWVRLLKAQLFNIGQRREEDFIVNKSVVNDLVFKVFVIRAIGQKVQFLLEATYSISCVVDHFSK